VKLHNGRSSLEIQLIIAVAIVVLAVLVPQPATAQAPVGTIEGVVTDSTGYWRHGDRNLARDGRDTHRRL
jgi:hypothetical protein